MKTEIYQVTLDHVWSDDKKVKIRYETLDRLGVVVSDASEEYGTGTFYADRSLIAELVINKIEFKVGSSSIVNFEMGKDGLLDALDRVHMAAEKLTHMASGTEGQFNQSCNVYMPGNAMLMFNETLLLEDHCTDALQEALNKGWRIIAACPQPDQRRPDYILGRYNPNNLDEMANMIDHRAHNAKRSIEK